MCSNAAYALLEPGTPNEDELKKTRKCTSCPEPSILVVRRVNGYCLSCYHEACRHKFRSTLGKSKKMSINDRVLVWLWPPLGAAAAVALLEEMRADTVHKKLQFQVEYAAIDGQGSLDSNSVLDRITDSSGRFHRIPRPTSAIPTQRNSTLHSSYEAIENLKAVIRFAKTLCCDKVFTCETGNDMAQQVLNSVALGRGCQLPDLTGLSVERDGITLLRPMREFCDEEVGKYLTSRNLPVPATPKLSTGIQKLTRDFVNGLHADFPSTAPTIWRTADKISVTSGTVFCDLCGCRLLAAGKPQSSSSSLTNGRLPPQAETELAGAMEALRVSAQLSTTLTIAEDRGDMDQRCYACRQMIVAR